MGFPRLADPLWIAASGLWGATVQVPLGLPPIPCSADNLYAPEKTEYGRWLYFDTRISADNSVSCATCPAPNYAFTDGLPVSAGIHQQKGTRNAPSIMNGAYRTVQFWDGRAASLAEPAVGLANPVETGNTQGGVVAKLKSIPGYRTLLAKAFGSEEFADDHGAKAIATFERTVLSGNSAYDRYQASNTKAMTPAQVRGRKVFQKAKSDKCRKDSIFSDNAFHHPGRGLDKLDPDLGRYTGAPDSKDWGAFKTPTLRDVAETPPYLHDGSRKTQVVDFYDKGGTLNKNLDPDIQPLKLTSDQRSDRAEFLRTLGGDSRQNIKAEKFPE
jgi:cytochrome c peroxidase